jgi:putative ABC transport system permease protein
VRAIDVVSGMILVILMLVLGNSMAMSTRESVREHAAMRAIGYRPRQILALVLGEGFVVAAIGIALGVALAPTMLAAFAKLLDEQVGGSWKLELALPVTLFAVGIALATSMAASARLSIVDCLRKVQ